jgi:hypothetical protein
MLTNLGSAVGVANGYGLDERGVGVQLSVESRIFISPYSPDRLLSPPNLLGHPRPFLGR